MKVEQYIDERLRTENLDKEGMVERYERLWRIDHMVKGLVTEAGELADLVKKELNYGSTIGLDRYMDELGDLEYYRVGLLDALYDQTNQSIDRATWVLELEDKIRHLNIEKLRTRYPHKFSQEHAESRDLEKEAKVFEK